MRSNFSKGEAALLAGLFRENLHKESISIRDIDLARSHFKETMLAAFEERLLIPLNSRSGPAWQDKILEFQPGVSFVYPPVVRFILQNICSTGQPSCDKAVALAYGDAFEEESLLFVRLLQSIMKHATNFQFEVGLLEILSKNISAQLELHDFLDLSVAGGMMSPCPRKSLLTRLSWYEINPILYWDKEFIP